MGTSVQETVIDRLKAYIRQGWLDKAKKSNCEFAQQIENLTPSQISFGKKPVYFEGYIRGNCTAVGEKTQNDVTTTRTINLDFNTETYVFIGSEDNIKLSKYAHKFFFKNVSLNRIAEEGHLAEKCGRRLAKQNLYDLNFWSVKEYRLNRYSFVKTNQYDLPVWPIYATLSDKQVFWGYWIDDNGSIKTDFDISIPLTKKQSLILAGVLGGIALAVILFIVFSKLL